MVGAGLGESTLAGAGGAGQLRCDAFEGKAHKKIQKIPKTRSVYHSWNREFRSVNESFSGDFHRQILPFVLSPAVLILTKYESRILQLQRISPTSNMDNANFQSLGRQVNDVEGSSGKFDQSVVEEIESFCVNCEQNVGFPRIYSLENS